MLLSQSMVHGQHIGPWITATQEWKFTTKRICIWSKSVLIRWACGRTLWLQSTVEGRSACYVAYKMGLLKIICCLALTTPRLNCWWYASLLFCNATDKLGLGCIANNSPHHQFTLIYKFRAPYPKSNLVVRRSTILLCFLCLIIGFRWSNFINCVHNERITFLVKFFSSCFFLLTGRKNHR